MCITDDIFYPAVEKLDYDRIDKIWQKNSTVSTNNVDSQRQENNVEVTFIIIHIFEMLLSFSDFEFGYCYL